MPLCTMCVQQLEVILYLLFPTGAVSAEMRMVENLIARVYVAARIPCCPDYLEISPMN
jgi:hypothetical protein